MWERTRSMLIAGRDASYKFYIVVNEEGCSSTSLSAPLYAAMLRKIFLDVQIEKEKSAK